MSIDRRQLEKEVALRKDFVEKVDNNAKEVKMKIKILDGDAPYYLYYNVTLDTSPGYAQYNVDNFLREFSRIDGVKLL